MRRLTVTRRELNLVFISLVLTLAACVLGNLHVTAEESQTPVNKPAPAQSPTPQRPEPIPRKIEGDWEGYLDAGGTKLRLVVHIIKKDIALIATLDSPDQGATGLPIDSITLESGSVEFEMNSLGGRYEGELSKDDSQIEGKWTQGGQTFPLILKRMGAPTVGAPAPETPLKLQKIDLGGRGLNLLIGGQRSAGTPVVILEGGFGAGIASWSSVQRDIARFAQVISYDRPGVGQSDPGPKPRDAKTIAADLHAALVKADIKPPYVLVGHSLGGPYVRVFAGMYPTEVSGLVLIDPSQEAFNAYLRLNPPPTLKEEEAKIAKAPQGVRDEYDAVQATYEQAQSAKVPSGVPVILLTATQDSGMPAEMKRVWAEKQKEWIAKVPGGKLVVAEKSGHFIQAQEPDLVIAAIKEVMEKQKRSVP
ncbi:MAG TPA: alpha/beta fold hydrolase [Pyrinomonadaceae bacterium]|nr:alpha/beta fold hydrolase [Pyrinomonadaceae bacterium]